MNVVELKPVEIISAWTSKLSPTEDQKKLAEARLKVCETCEFAKEFVEGKESLRYCSKCGCILAAKAYSYVESACPEGKWAEIDKQYRDSKALKVLKNPKSPLV